MIKPMTRVYKLVFRLFRKEIKFQDLGGGNRTHNLHNSGVTALPLSYQPSIWEQDGGELGINCICIQVLLVSITCLIHPGSPKGTPPQEMTCRHLYGFQFDVWRLLGESGECLFVAYVGNTRQAQHVFNANQMHSRPWVVFAGLFNNKQLVI